MNFDRLVNGHANYIVHTSDGQSQVIPADCVVLSNDAGLLKVVKPMDTFADVTYYSPTSWTTVEVFPQS